MWVSQATAGDPTVRSPDKSFEKALVRVRGAIGAKLTRVLGTGNPTIHSPALLRSLWPERVNAADADVVHLHWVNREMLSVADIGRVRKPIVWTLHDMWAFCGAEHYTDDSRWREGYFSTNRPAHESGFDLNRWTWNRKRKYWNHPMHVIAPSSWLGNCVRESALMKEWTVSVIPNVIDTNEWQPVEKSLARRLLGLPLDVPLLLFGAMGGGKDPRKGFDLLQEALKRVPKEVSDLQLLVIGELAPREPADLNFAVHYMGHLHDAVSLRLVNSAADVVIVPSRQDNLPQAGTEAQACGCPVVAFNTCGLPDVVAHQETGYLARPFDVDDLAEGIAWVLDGSERLRRLSGAARERAVRLWSPSVVIPQYMEAYRSAVEMH